MVDNSSSPSAPSSPQDRPAAAAGGCPDSFPASLSLETNSTTAVVAPAAPATRLIHVKTEPADISAVAKQTFEHEPGSSFTAAKVERNVYSFHEDETLAQSLDQYRRQLQHQPQPVVFAAAAVNEPPPPPLPVLPPQPQPTATAPAPTAAIVSSCATSVIKENIKIKEEPKEERSDTPTSGDENQFDRSLLGLKEPEPKIDDTECHKSTNAM